MKSPFIYISFILFLFLSCQNDKISSSFPIISPSDFKQVKFELSFFAENIEYVKLDPNILFKRILQIDYFDGKYITSTYECGVMLYSEKGKFLKQLMKKGDGPGEFRHCLDFSLDRDNRRIYINAKKKVLVFSFDGKYVREFKRTFEYIRFVYSNGFLYGLSPVIIGGRNNRPNWIVYDTLGNKVFTKENGMKGSEKREAIGIGINCFYLYNNSPYYWNDFNDTIFKLCSTSYSPKYLFKKDKYRLTPELATERKNIGYNQYYSLNNILESNNYLFIKYLQYSYYNLCLYDKSINKFTTCKISKDARDGIANNLDGGMSIIPKHYLVKDGNEYLVKIVDAIDLIEHVNSEEFKRSKPIYPEKKRALIKLVNNLNENDNPVLMLVKLKH